VDIDRIAWTVRRTPEVMVKVLSRGSQNLKAVHVISITCATGR
jgi:hypothetical protein